MGRYTKAYTGTLAVVCAGAIVAAVHANEKASRLGELDAAANRWEAWARNEHGRDARAYARYVEVAQQYRVLARRIESSQRQLKREIAVTRSLHRTVVNGTPIVSYVRVRRVVPIAAAPPAAAPGSTTTTGQAPPPDTATKQKPLTPTKPAKAGSAPVTTTPASASPGSAPATGTPTTPGSTPSTTTTGGTPPSSTTPGNTPSTTTTGGTPPPPTTPAAPVNTALPTITGVPQSSKIVSATPGSWTGSPTSFQYQWQRCDASGAGCVVVGSGQSYTCVPSDIDMTLRVAVQATNAGGSAVAVSAASPKTKPS